MRSPPGGFDPMQPKRAREIFAMLSERSDSSSRIVDEGLRIIIAFRMTVGLALAQARISPTAIPTCIEDAIKLGSLNVSWIFGYMFSATLIPNADIPRLSAKESMLTGLQAILSLRSDETTHLFCETKDLSPEQRWFFVKFRINH